VPWAAPHAQCDSYFDPDELQPMTSGRVLRVKSTDPLLSLAATSRAARDGDIIEVESGEYRGDVSSWPQSDLLIRGVGVRPRVLAEGKNAEGKAIMVVKGRRVRIENLEFHGARVRDRNGAGVRVESGPFTVLNCAFVDNENGILTGNLSTVEISVQNSAFENNGNGDGSAHNLYVGAVARLDVIGCLFSRSRVGHLLKSRARVTTLRYSRLTGEDGNSSYELDLPDGGEALILGNLFQQGPASENSTIVSYGAEGYRWPKNVLQLAFNTVINDRSSGIFVRAAKGAERVLLENNVWIGKGEFRIDAALESHGNVEATRSDFADPSQWDYRPRVGSRLVGRAGFRGADDPKRLLPDREYRAVASSCPIEGATPVTPLTPGAFQRVAR
jgi:hypothetical protein